MVQHLVYSKNLWNESLEHCKKFYSDFGFLPSIRTLEGLSKGSGLYAQAGQCIAHRLHGALIRFFVLRTKGIKVGFPRFKSIDRVKSMYYPQFGFHLNASLNVTPFGWISIRKHREVKGRIKTLALKREASGKWFAIFTVEGLLQEPRENESPVVGLDLGLMHFATFSNGLVVPNPRFLRRRERKLASLHRKLSKKVKRSKNRFKAKVRLALGYEKLTNARRDFLHKLSTGLVNTYSLIALEKLNVRKMSRGGFGKFIHDVSWSMFANMLGYKAEGAGCQVVFVNPKNTSKECSTCGNLVEKELRDRVHSCSNCGLVINRDLNAALNILAKATGGTPASNACGNEANVSSMTQETPGFGLL